MWRVKRTASFAASAALALLWAGCGAFAGGTGDGGGAGGSCDGNCRISFGSDPDWSVYDLDPARNDNARRLGPAVTVCLAPDRPSNCPLGAVWYGAAGNSWVPVLFGVSGTRWVWAPSAAPTAASDLKSFSFARTFTVGDAPTGRLSIAADDAAEVRVNGIAVGTVGSTEAPGSAGAAGATVATFELTPGLRPGKNTITVFAQNGPDAFADCNAPCTYAGNPAGVNFGGWIMY